MSDVWGAVSEGFRIGGALRQQREQRQRDEAYGQAYQDNGWAGVEQAAGARGDLETANTVQDNANTQQETAIRRATRNAEVLANAATSLMGMPYEQRQARIQQMAPMLTQMGLPEDQIMSFDPTDEALAGIRAVNGQFSQYEDIRQQGDDIVGIRADGSTQVLRQGRGSAPTGHRWTQDGQAVERIPGWQPPNNSSNFTLSPEATDFVARQYSQGGDIPSGLSRGGRIAPIIERATQLAAEQGATPEEVAVRRSTYAANARALRERTSQRAAVHNFERTTLANIRLAASLGGQVDRNGIPVIDRWINAGRIATGDPDVAAYHNAITGAMTEYAKVLSGATGAAGVTEGAREEAEAMWNTAHSPAQVARMLEEMEASMHNRIVGMDQEIESLQELMRGSGVNEAGEMITSLPPIGQGDPEGPGGGIGAMVGRNGRRGPALDELSDEELDRLERELSQ